MSCINSYIAVKPYIRDWTINHFGNPVRFPRNSVEDMLLRQFMSKWPKDLDVIPHLAHENLTIALPSMKAKDPRVYNYLSPLAKKAIGESLETLFINNLWTELSKILGYNCNLTTLIDSWLEQHGVSLDHEEAIRQRFYRLRSKYHQKGINLRQIRSEKI